jgi:hypothetical protein
VRASRGCSAPPSHHLHASMEVTLTPRLARRRGHLEFDVALVVYRCTTAITRSKSSQDELVRALPLRAERIAAVRRGIDGWCSPGGARSEGPPVGAKRLVPVKPFPGLSDASGAVRARRGALTEGLASRALRRRRS